METLLGILNRARAQHVIFDQSSYRHSSSQADYAGCMPLTLLMRSLPTCAPMAWANAVTYGQYALAIARASSLAPKTPRGRRRTIVSPRRQDVTPVASVGRSGVDGGSGGHGDDRGGATRNDDGARRRPAMDRLIISPKHRRMTVAVGGSPRPPRGGVWVSRPRPRRRRGRSRWRHASADGAAGPAKAGGRSAWDRASDGGSGPAVAGEAVQAPHVDGRYDV